MSIENIPKTKPEGNQNKFKTKLDERDMKLRLIKTESLDAEKANTSAHCDAVTKEMKKLS